MNRRTICRSDRRYNFLSQQRISDKDLKNPDFVGATTETIEDSIKKIVELARTSKKHGFMDVSADVLFRLSRETKQKIIEHIQELKKRHDLSIKDNAYEIKEFVRLIAEDKDTHKEHAETGLVDGLYKKLRSYFS